MTNPINSISLYCGDCNAWHPLGSCLNALIDPVNSFYIDDSGATHTLWTDEDGTANARIDFTMPND